MINVKIEYNKCAYLFDQGLSLKAKGVMALMCAYINKNSHKATFRLEDVRELSADGRTAFSNAIGELKFKGYFRQDMVGNKYTGAMWEYILKE